MIGKRKLFEFLRITEIKDSYLANTIYNIIVNLGKAIDWERFIAFISIICKGHKDEKLRLFYLLFAQQKHD